MISLTRTAHGVTKTSPRERQGRSRAALANQASSVSTIGELVAAGANRGIGTDPSTGRPGWLRWAFYLKKWHRRDDRLDSHWTSPHRAERIEGVLR
jgi:hypothetical protein